MKKLFTLIALLGMCISGAWAEVGDVTTNVNVDCSAEISELKVAGTKGNLVIANGKAGYEFANVAANNSLMVGYGTATATIDPSEYAGNKDVVSVKFDLAFGKLTGKNVNFYLKDAEGNNIASFDFSPYGNTLTTNLDVAKEDFYYAYNTVIWARRASFTILLDYAKKQIKTSVKNNFTSGTTNHTVSMTNSNPLASFVVGSNYENNARACQFANLLITTTEGDYTTATANYTVRYLNAANDQVIKAADATRVGDVGSTPVLLAADKEAIYNNDKKYVYASDDASSLTVADDNSTVVTVRFNEVAKYNYTITAEDANHNEIKNLTSGATFADEPVNMYIPLHIYSAGKLYGISGENSWRSFTITSNNQKEIITYPNEINNVVAFVEGEDATGAAVSTPTGNLQLASCGHMGRGTNLPVADLTAGVYNLYLHYINTNSGAHAVTIKAGEDVVKDFSLSNRPTVETGNFTVTDQASITFTATGSSTSGIDYIYIVKTGDVCPVTSYGYATFSTPYAVDLDNLTDGYTAYVATASTSETVTIEPASGVVPANTGLIIKGAEGTCAIPVSAAAGNDPTTNYLVAVTADNTEVRGAGNYVLGVDEGVVKFLQCDQTAAHLNAGKAYLRVTPGAKALRFVVGGTTGIENIASAKATNKAVKRIMNGQLVIEKAGKMYNAAGQVTK